MFSAARAAWDCVSSPLDRLDHRFTYPAARPSITRSRGRIKRPRSGISSAAAHAWYRMPGHRRENAAWVICGSSTGPRWAC